MDLLLKRLLFKLIDEIYLFIQPHLTASKAFQVATYAAVNLGFDQSILTENLRKKLRWIVTTKVSDFKKRRKKKKNTS